jgi:hypothetical protein
MLELRVSLGDFRVSEMILSFYIINCNALFTRLFSLKVISIRKAVYVRLSRGILLKSHRENFAVL